MNFQSLVGSLRRKAFSRANAQTRARKRTSRLRIEELEKREVPATLPAPQVDQTSFRSIQGEGWANAMMANPTNPNEIFMAYVHHAGNGTRIGIKFSTNGGTTWSAPLRFIDPILGGNNEYIPTGVDPVHLPAIVPFEDVSDPNLAWDKFGNVFLTYTEYHTPGDIAGRVMLRKFSFVGAPNLVTGPSAPPILYAWFNSTSAHNPNVAVDSNEGSFQDPDLAINNPAGRQEDDLAAAQLDKDNTRVFVTYNTLVVDTANAVPANINPNAIIMRYSDDGGREFSGSLLVNNDRYAVSGGPYVYSDTVFTPGRAGELDSGGRMTTVFSSNSGGPNNLPTIKSDTISFNQTTGVPKMVNIIGQGGAITDAIDGTDPDIDIPVPTLFPIDASAAAGVITKIDNISLTLHANHQDLRELRIRLIAPNGASILLVNNRIDQANNDFGEDVGLEGTTLGGGGAADTVFNDAAFWFIEDGEEPYRGDFLPESGDSLEAVFANVPANQIGGIWQLQVIDHRASQTGGVSRIELRLGQAIKNTVGIDRAIASATAVAANHRGTGHPNLPSFAPAMGLGPNPRLVVDNTLGAFSPYQNRMYVAYTGITQTGEERVFVQYADGVDAAGGALWNTVPINVGRGYLPQLTVDPTSGTLVLAYYTSKYDSANARSTMVMQTAVNMADYRDRLGVTIPGPDIEFNTAVHMTPEEQAFDQIRSRVLSVETIPSNGAAAADVRQWGNSFGLATFNGMVNLVYPGNLNIAGTQLRTQEVQITSGPRVVGGDMGPILGDGSVTPLVWSLTQHRTVNGTPIPYNTPGASGDGRNRFTRFLVTFDRVIDPTSFTVNDVKVIFRSPTDDPVGPGTNLGVSAVTPVDDIRDPVDDTPYGSKRFLVTLTQPQEAVGTYSYLIGSNQAGVAAQIRDRVRGPILGYANAGVPQTFTYTPVPPDQIVDWTGNPAPLTTTIIVPAFPAGVVVGDVNIRVNIAHPDVSDLRLELLSPAGQVIALANPGDANLGANYQNTTFDDQSGNTLQNQFPPYANLSVRPTQRLSQLFAANPAGAWQLRITDEESGDVGVLNNWSIIIQGVVATFTTSNNNFIDQNGNGIENDRPLINPAGDLETPDGFSIPDPKSDIVFELPYQVGSLPVVIPGPRVVKTHVPGQFVPGPGLPPNTENVVKDTTAKSIDIEFDRVINASTFTPADVLRIIGPLGDIPLNGVKVTPTTGLDASVTVGNSQFFRIEFAQQKLSGNYTVQLSSQIADTEGNLMDTNTNAGVGNLLGSVTGADVEPRPYGGVLTNDVVIPAKSTVAVNLNVADSYQLKRALVHFTILSQDPDPSSPNALHTRDLEGRLVAPDGTTVLLFVNSPEDGDDALGFQDTTLDDAATTPVQLGGGGFPAPGTFNPMQPLAQLIDHTSKGVWRLVITNKGDQVGLVHKFALTLDKPVVGTGLGEEVSDQTSVGFRIFQTDGGSPTAKGNWTPVGPSPQFQQGSDVTGGQVAAHAQDVTSSTSGRVGSIAVDPSDPSGNTVYVSGASGGVWRTTNFLTRDVNGPQYVALTDFGPNQSINIGSLQVFNNTGDPNKTFILVGTGSDDLNNLAKSEHREDIVDQNTAGFQEHRYDGVGFLLSEDAGKTWQVLDSTNNFDVTTDVYRPVSDSGRDHLFVGAVVNRIVYETNVDSNSLRPIIYAAVGRGGLTGAAGDAAAGLWRSRDGGRTWVKIALPATGDVSDFLFGQGSQLPNSFGRPTFGYVAIVGSGVYFTSDLDSDDPSFSLMGGGVGRPTVMQGGVATGASETPNGAHGKIVLAAPALDGSALANNYYQRWLYVAEANADGTFRGLYMTKDRGLNWTKLKLTAGFGATINGFNAFGFSDLGPDVDLTMFDPVTLEGWQGGNHALTLAVDPNDPNIVYFGSDALVRVDATLANDPYFLSLYNHSNEDGGLQRPDTAGGATDIGPPNNPPIGGGLIAFDFSFIPPLASTTPNTGNYNTELTAGARRKKWNHLNLDRDPYAPFLSDTSLFTNNTLQFNNTGGDVRWTLPGGALANGDFDYDWISQIITIQDPITGKARIIFGHDEGITSYVPEASGAPEQIIGFGQDYQIQGDGAVHNDLQITSKRNGNLQTARMYSGDTAPSLLAADLSNALLFGAARRRLDAQRSTKGTLGTGSDDWKGINRTGRANFVAVDQTGDGTAYVLRRINDLLIKTDFFQVSLNGNAPISRTNGLFQNDTTDPTGFGQWDNTVRVFAVNSIDGDGLIMGSSVGRLFRTRDQGLNWNPIAEPTTLDGSYLTALAFGAPPPESTNLNDFIYAGSTDGNIFVTTVGGGNLPGSWTNITTGSFGTLDGSAIMKIVPNPVRGSRELFAVTRNGIYHMANWEAPGALWENITTNIRTITNAGFGNSSWVVPVLATTNPITTMAVDWRPVYGQTQSQPILYVGGDGGVFKAIYNADQTFWARYTGTANGSSSDGGGLPNVKVTDLDLALGNIDPNTGKVIPAGSPDALIATTLGRGTWSIAIDVPAGFSGPRVIESSPTTPQFAPITSVRIKFDSFINATSFTVADVTITGPNGQLIAATSVTEDPPPPPNQPDLHDVWFINFPALNADGTYTITVGPNILSGATPMDQDGDAINGEPVQDQFKMSVIIGLNDLADFVKDTYQDLLNRLPTTAEFAGTTIKNMETVRFTALGVIVREFLSTFNASEARQKLIGRLFNNGNAAGEIGHLLPGYDPVGGGDVAFYTNALKNGTRSPEGVLIDIIATNDVNKGFYQDYYVAAGNSPGAFLNRLYQDLFKGTGIQFSWLPTNVQTTQLNTASTPVGRLNLTRSLVNGALVKYTDPAQPGVLKTIDFRTHMVNLTYQRYLGRAATPAEVTAGKSLMARPLAANSINGSEWLYHKVLASKEYFNLAPAQADGLPDDGLHTNRAWVQAVIDARMYRASTSGEEDIYSQKVLDRFKTQRTAFISALVNGTAYRDLQITDYFQHIHSRNPTDVERTAAQTALKNLATYQGLMSGRYASAEFFSTNAPAIAGGAPNTTTWARAVYIKLFNLNLAPNDPRITALAAQGGTIPARQTAVLALLNGQAYRDILITDRFQLLLGRLPTGNELTAYQNWLKTRRWESIIIDIVANGAANPTITSGLPREYWEVAN